MNPPPRIRLVLAAAFFLLGLLLANATSASAQGIIIEPVPPVEPLLPLVGQIKIGEHRVEAVIDGPVANVQVTQVFRNDTGHPVEGVYVFPLPAEAAVSDFQMTVDGKVLEGKLLNKDEARRVYEEIVRSLRDPALLEYVGRNLFQTSVFPIPAGESRTLELSYTQVVPQRQGLYEFTYPLRTQQYSATPVGSLAISVELRNQPGLRTIYSPNHAIGVVRTADTSARIGFEAADVQPESDFKLYFGTARSEVGLNLLSYKPAGEDGYFVLLAAPGVEIDQQMVVARDLVLVLDVSGSMQGDKIKQAQQAAHFVVDQLNPEDRFNLVSFSTGVRLWQSSLQPVDQTTLQDAHTWIDRLAATGSTDINRALLEALAQMQRPGVGDRPGYILFLTDGLPTMGETDAQRIIGNALNNKPNDSAVRLFNFGIGFDVNTDLLDTLSQELGGRSTYVTPQEAIDEELGNFYVGISTPVLVDLALEFADNLLVDDLYPYPLPDLFAGDQLVVTGRYRNGGSGPITLRGAVNGQQMIFQYDGQSLVQNGGEPFVARLWATRKIGALLDQVRRTGPHQEIIDEIVELSLHYGIVTPYTSYLVVEPDVVQQWRLQSPAPKVDLYRRVADAVEEEIAAYAAAPASGEGAVTAAETRSELANAINVREAGGVRYVGGKTFVRQSLIQTVEGQTVALWVDTRYTEGMAIETVTFGSARYFELAKQPQTAQWLAISPELIIVTAPGKALRITTVQP